ncbi:MAG: DUF6702 family protein [Mariniblastus sp.]
MLTIKSKLILMLICVASALVSAEAIAHPYHVSRTELNWNPKTGNFEVALCLWPADLEKALSREQGKPIDLDKADNLDDMLQAYVEKTFLIRNENSANGNGSEIATKVRWVGHEKDLKQAWLYFEVVVEKTVVQKSANGKPAGVKASGEKAQPAVGGAESSDQSQADSQVKWTVENRAFFELNEDQLNYLQLTVGEKSEVAISKTGSERHAIAVGQ